MNFKNEEEYRKYLNAERKRFLGAGFEGQSILLKNDLVLKDYFKPRDIEEKDKLLQFKDIDLDSFSFTKDVCNDDEKIYGAITKYANGLTVENCRIYDDNAENLCNNLQKLSDDINKLTELNILINDNFLDNIVYDGNKFTMIDTQCYEYNQEEIDDLLAVNLGIIEHIYFKLLGTFIDYHLRRTDSDYKDCFYDKYLLSNPKETLMGIKEELENYLGEDYNSFFEIRKDLSRKMSK